MSQNTLRPRSCGRSAPRDTAVAEALLGKLPAELALQCIDAIDSTKTLLAMAQVNQATRALVVETPAYQAFTNKHQGAMLAQALRRSGLPTSCAGLRSAQEVHLFQLPLHLRSAAHARKVLGSAAAIKTLALDVHWLEAPYARALLDGVTQSSTLRTLRVVRHLDGAQGPRRTWDQEDISPTQLRTLTALAIALARKGQATLSLDIPLGAQATQSLLQQALPAGNTLKALAFSLPASMGLAEVAGLAESLSRWTSLEQVRLDPGNNSNRRDLGLPKLEAFLDAMASGWKLKLLDVSRFSDVKNSALAAVQKRLDTLGHVGTIRCHVSTTLHSLPTLGAPLASMDGAHKTSYAPRIETIQDSAH